MSQFKLESLEEIESWADAFDTKFSASGDEPVSQKAASFMAEAIGTLARELRQLRDKCSTS